MEVRFTPEFEKSLRKMMWQQRLAPINPAEWRRKIKWFIQRGQRGYSDADLWGVYYPVARMVRAYCEEYGHSRGMGYPMGTTEKSWQKTLVEIEWLMNEVINEDTPVEVMQTEAYQTRRDKANKLFGKYWQNLWD